MNQQDKKQLAYETFRGVHRRYSCDNIPRSTAAFTNVPLELGFNKAFEELRPYVNRELFSIAIRGRGGRSAEHSKANKTLWAFYNANERKFGTGFWASSSVSAYQSLPLELAETASIYLVPKPNRTAVTTWRNVPLDHRNSSEIFNRGFAAGQKAGREEALEEMLTLLQSK